MRRREDRTVAALRSLPLLAGCDHRHVRQVARGADETIVPEGGVLLRAGEQAVYGCFVLLSGELRVQGQGWTGVVREPGALFGCRHFVDGSAETTTVTAGAATRVLALTRSGSQALIALSSAASGVRDQLIARAAGRSATDVPAPRPHQAWLSPGLEAELGR